MSGNESNSEARTAESLIGEVKARRAQACVGCAQALWPQEILMSIALGFGRSPRCLGCLAAGMGTVPDELAGALFDYIRQRECFAEAWRWACVETGWTPEGVPLKLLRARPGER